MKRQGGSAETTHPPGPGLLHLHRPAFYAHGGLADGFGHGRVGVAGAGEVFGGRTEFHGDADLMDHLTDADAHHVRAEDAVGLGIGKDFHKAGRLMIGPRAGIGLEGEFALLVLDAGLFQLGFGLADPGDLRVRPLPRSG